MRHVQVLPALLALAALALVGCTADPTPTPIVSSTAAVPLPEPTPTLTEASQPERLFGGNCDAAFEPAAVTAIWGADARLARSPIWYPGVAEVEQLSGISCGWSDEDFTGSADLVVLPISTAPAEELGEPYCYGACRFSVVSADLWLSGVVVAGGGDESAIRAAIQTLTDAFVASAAAQPAVAPRPSGSWRPMADCASTMASANLTEVLGESGSGGSGNGPSEIAPGRYTATRVVGTTSCRWESDGPFSFSMKATPGAAWVESDLRADGEVQDASVVGAQSAFWKGPPGLLPELHVFSEGNWLRIQPNVEDSPATRDFAVRAAEALIRAMPPA